MVRTNNINLNVVRTKMQEDSSKKNRWGDSRPGTTKKFIRFPNEMIEQIDNDRNFTSDGKAISFSEWVKNACMEKLK